MYRVDGDARELVSAMFIAKDTPIDDPELVDYGGPLMQWHVHDNLCWGLDDNGRPVVRASPTPTATAPPGTINAGGDNPMVHVWIAPHECGPFAALEGHGAGQAADRRTTRPTSAPTTTPAARTAHAADHAADAAGRLRPDQADRPRRASRA